MEQTTHQEDNQIDPRLQSIIDDPDMNQVRADPYNFICNYVEDIYPKTGRQVFEVLSLMPVSLIIPDFSYDTKTVKSNISALFLAPSGSGKTSLADLFASLTYHPIKVESITSAKLEHEISKAGIFSLVVGDFARMSSDHNLLKVLEGILGEEKRISRQTMRQNLQMETEGIGLLCGVATDLHMYILGGIIFRVVPILVGHDVEEHAQIGEYIVNKIGKKADSSNREELIRNYYYELAKVQSGEHPKIPEIVGYEINDIFRTRIIKIWKIITDEIVRDVNGSNWFRELQEFFRFLIAHAFLNVFNRKHENGILVPDERDFKVAQEMMVRMLRFKYRLLKSQNMAKGLTNAKEFYSIINSDKVPKETKDILRNLVRIDKNRVRLG